MFQNKVTLTPQDILEKEFKIDTRGYRLKEVDQFLDIIIGDYEALFKIIRDNEKEVLDIEASRIMHKICNDDYVILLDLHGQSLDSISLAKKIDKLFLNHSKIVFVIGGSLGLGEEIRKRANYRLKLSDLTFLHQMTRLIILEQIYRCFKILNNTRYHK